MAFTPGLQYRKSKVNQDTSSGSGSGGGGIKEQTVPVNPLTYEEDPNSTFRVPLSQVKKSSGVVDTQSIGGSSGSTFQTSNGKVGYASSGVSEIRQGGKGEGGFVVATNKPIVNVSSGVARKILSERRNDNVVSSDKVDNGFTTKAVVLSVKDNKQGAPKQSIDFLYSRPSTQAKDVSKQKVNIQEDKLQQFKSSIVKKEEPTVFSKGKEFATGFVEIPKEFIKGNFILASRASGKYFGNPFVDQNLKNKSVKQLVSEDKNVKTAVVGDILVAGASASPVVAGGLAIGGTGIGAIDVIKGTQKSDYGQVGRGGFEILTGAKFTSLTRPIVEFTGTKINAKDVFGGEISGKKVTSGSTSEALSQFREGKLSDNTIDVVSVSPNRLKGLEIGAGPKGSAGIEDSGLFVGPVGRANLQFSGLGTKTTSSEVGLSVDGFFASRPTVNILNVKDVVVPKASSLSEAGFINVNKPFEGEGVAVITKRSMIGKGEVSPQLFSPVQDIKVGKLVRQKGNLYREAGTSETEATIPQNSLLQRTSGKTEFYTVVNQKQLFGRDVPLTGDLIELPKYKVQSSKSRSDFVGRETTIGEVSLNQESSLSSLRSGSRKVNVFGGGTYGLSQGSEKLLSNEISSSVRGSGATSVGLLSSKSSSGFSNSFVSSASGFSQSSGFSSSKVSRGTSGLSVGSFVSSPKSLSKSVLSSPFTSRSGLFGQSYKSGLDKVGGRVIGSDFRFKTGGGNSFSVDVRSKGKFSTVGEGLNLKDAVKLGQNITGSSSARSFKIKRKSGSNKPLTGLDVGGRYYQKNGVFIEKSKYAINTGGELSQITFKGVNAQRKKGIGVF